MIVFGARACAVLYQLFRTRRDHRAVLFPANVCPQVPLALHKAGQGLRCVDIDPVTLAIDTAACQRLLASDVAGFSAIVHVRPYGARIDCDPLFAELKRSWPDLLLIDDACLAPPDIEGGSVSPYADVTLFSTGPRKYAELGFGAFAHLASGVRYESHPDVVFDAPQWDALEARLSMRLEGALEWASSAWLDAGPLPCSTEHYVRSVHTARGEAARHKERINAIYQSAIPSQLQLPARFQQWRFNVLLPQADAFCTSLQQLGLFAGRHYRALGSMLDAGPYPHAEALAARVVNLFNDRYVDEAAAHRIAERMRAFFDGGLAGGIEPAEPGADRT